MSNECKLAPGIWHPISAINDTNRYEPSFLLHCPDLICSDFNPSGVVEGHWCDDEGWQAAVWCGYHDEFHTKFVTPTLIMTIPSIAAPQPPALGGVPAGLDLQRIVTEALMGMIAAVTSTSPPANEPPPPFIQAGIDRAVSRVSAHFAPLKAEIEHLRAGGALIVQHMNDYKKERDQLKAEAETLSETAMAQESMIEQLKEESFEGLYNAALDERDQLQARCDELEKAFRKLRDVAHGCQQIASSYSPCIDSVEEHGGDDHEDPSCAIHHRLYYAMFDADAALSKPAGNDKA
ncbi:hypothetical protein [Pseudomonas viridiflava]|uniref:hypothetical protein n=2 Tax=Pseudomonas viridiflava TaxID=33069 RepID=UPI0013CF1D99|nr:hypothetical protein [Pseudomonas viridiflava]